MVLHFNNDKSLQIYFFRVKRQAKTIFLKTSKAWSKCVVVVRILNIARHQRHIEAAAIVMYMYLYSLAFMDNSCTLGAAVCYQAPPCPLYTPQGTSSMSKA